MSAPTCLGVSGDDLQLNNMIIKSIKLVLDMTCGESS